MLMDAPIRGKLRSSSSTPTAMRSLALDRVTGEFIAGQAYAKQTWAKGLDDKGRPIVIPGTEPNEAGNLVYPALNGATIWYSPSYSPKTNLVYVATREAGATYFKREADYKPGTFFAGGGERRIPESERWGAIRALEPTTGKQAWEYKLLSPPWTGVMSTAGGLVISGSNEGNIFRPRRPYRQAAMELPLRRPGLLEPHLLQIDGRQHIAIAANRVLYVFGL